MVKKVWTAQQANYWQSSRSSEAAIESALNELRKIGGEIVSYAYGVMGGRAAHVVVYKIEGNLFRTMWPVLKTHKGEIVQAAKVQAAVALKHEIKARCVAYKWRGVMGSFGNDFILPSGRTISELTAPEIAENYPKMLDSTAGE